MEVHINNKTYNVKEAKTEEELQQGLKGVESLPEDEGMLFYMQDELPQQVFTMKDVKIPLDIIFINQDQEVIDVHSNCKPEQKYVISDTKNIEEDDYIAYVLEVNSGSEIKVGDTLDLEEDNSGPVMKVLASDGSTQYELWGGERIFRRAFTKQLVKWAKKADSVKNNEEEYNRICKRIGKKMFKEIKAQDTRDPEYVSLPN